MPEERDERTDSGMNGRTAQWSVPHAPGTALPEAVPPEITLSETTLPETRLPETTVPQAEGLRERKKRLMRQQLSESATPWWGSS